MRFYVKPVVDALLKRHGGGTPFFDELDSTLRHPFFFLGLLRSVESNHGYIGYDGIATSGAFGAAFARWAKSFSGAPPVYVWPGNLRHNPHRALEVSYSGINGKHLVFLDDSYYKGRTHLAVQSAAMRDGATVCDAFVIYDGSRDKVRGVFSFYRYFDFHR